jgi:hypothetical protein
MNTPLNAFGVTRLEQQRLWQQQKKFSFGFLPYYRDSHVVDAVVTFVIHYLASHIHSPSSWWQLSSYT